MKHNKKMIKKFDARQKAYEATMASRNPGDSGMSTRIATGGYKRPGSRKLRQR